MIRCPGLLQKEPKAKLSCKCFFWKVKPQRSKSEHGEARKEEEQTEGNALLNQSGTASQEKPADCSVGKDSVGQAMWDHHPHSGQGEGCIKGDRCPAGET